MISTIPGFLPSGAAHIVATIQTPAVPPLLITIVVATSLFGLVSCETPVLGTGFSIEREPEQLGEAIPVESPVQGVDL